MYFRVILRAIVIVSLFLATLAVGPTTSTASAVAPSCSPTMTVSDRTELADAIDCYNLAAAGTTTTITVAAAIGLGEGITFGEIINDPTIADLPAIDNATTAELVIDGGGYTIDAQGHTPYVFFQTDGQTTISNIELASAFDNFGMHPFPDRAAVQIDGGSASIERSTIRRNRLGVCACSDELTAIINSTVAGNFGDGLFVEAGSSATVQQSTLSSNDGFGISNVGANVTLSGSLIVDNFDECDAPVATDALGNAIRDESCTGTSTPYADFLNSPTDNGCVVAPCTQTVLIEAGFPAVDRGGNCSVLTDQRGFPRTAGKCDAGSLEAYDCVTTVTTDVEMAVALGCLTDAPAGETTTVTLANDIVLDAINGLPTLFSFNEPSVIIDGAGHTLDGNDRYGLLRNINLNLTLRDITLTGSTVVAVNSPDLLDRVTIIENQAGVSVGGSFEPKPPLVIRNSTIADNVSNGVFVGIFANVQIEHSTIVDNGGFGIRKALGPDASVTIVGSLLANAGGNCSVPFTDGLGNVISDDTCTGVATPAAAGPYAPAADNGCDSCPPTIAIPGSSPTVDAAGTCGLATDQRLVERSDGSCDAGAFENEPPSAVADTYEGETDTTLVVTAVDGLLANDSDPENDALTVMIDPTSSHVGSLTLGEDGSFSYTPPVGFLGDVTFDYLVSDRATTGVVVGTATIAIVTPRPRANEDEAGLVAPNSVLIDVLANDVVSEAIVVTVTGDPAQGTATIEDGRIRYVPGVSTSTSDSLVYEICIDTTCDSATVMISITPPTCRRQSSIPLVATIWGTNDADVITGTSGDDVIVAFGGDDVVDGVGGDNTICLGNGDDTANSGSGRDFIRGGNGVDTISAGLGIDRLWGDAGDDTINGEGGSDRIRAGLGNDIVNAGSGADRVYGGPGNDTLRGQGGQDSMWGEAGNDIMQGNFQSDALRGGEGDDDIRGSGGRDKIFGDGGDDMMFGGNNSDLLVGGPGNDTANGQRGKDNPFIPGERGCDAETQISC